MPQTEQPDEDETADTAAPEAQAPPGADEEAPIPLHLTRDWRPAAPPDRKGAGLPAERVLGLFEGELPEGWCGEPAILAITSGKGGVGKSSIAGSLALLLAAAGARVSLIDADLALGHLDVLLGVQPPAVLGDVLAGRKALRDIFVPLAWGAEFAGGGMGPAPSRVLAPTRRLKLLDEISALRAEYDLTVLDCSSGVGGEVLDFCGIADRIFVVATPEPTALTAAYGLLKALAGRDELGKAAVVVNQAADREEAEDTHERIAAVARQFLGRSVADGGYVLTDPAVAHAVRKRRPFLQAYPRCEASRCLAQVAARVLPAGRDRQRQRQAGLLARILGYLE